VPEPINRDQLALFGPSPAEREAHRVRVLQGRFGIGPPVMSRWAGEDGSQ